MTTEETSDPELGGDQHRIQVVSRKPVRDYIRERTNRTGLTYSQQLDEWLPDNWEDVEFGYTEREVVNIKLIPEVQAKVDSMAGDRVKAGDIIAYYALQQALENDDLEAAAGIMTDIPELLWEVMEMQDLKEHV